MSIVTAQTLINNTNYTQKYLLWIKNTLVTLAGWTVAGSRGTGTGGMDAVDRILTETDLILDSYFVLQSPHTNAADRIQILFHKNIAGSSFCQLWYAPEADYTGGVSAPTLPSSAYDVLLPLQECFTVGATPGRVTLLADNEEPYGWAVFANQQQLITTVTGGMAFIPIDNQPVNPGKPYVLYHGGSQGTPFQYPRLTNPGVGLVEAVSACQPTGTQPVAATNLVRALYMRNSAGIVFPGGASQDDNGDDIRVPIPYCVGPIGEYIGTSSFMQWNGVDRPNLSLLNNRTRIVFGHVSFPWDGVTVPLI